MCVISVQLQLDKDSSLVCWILLKESVSTVRNRAFTTGILVVEHTVTSPTSLLPAISLSPTNPLLSSTNYSSFDSPAPLSCGSHSFLFNLLSFTIPSPYCLVLFHQQMVEQESSQQTGDSCRFRVPKELFSLCTDCCVCAVFKQTIIF